MTELRRLTSERIVTEVNRILTTHPDHGWAIGSSGIFLFHSPTKNVYRVNIRSEFFDWVFRVIIREPGGQMLLAFYLGPFSEASKALRRLKRYDREQEDLRSGPAVKARLALEVVSQLPAAPGAGGLALADHSGPPVAWLVCDYCSWEGPYPSNYTCPECHGHQFYDAPNAPLMNR